MCQNVRTRGAPKPCWTLLVPAPARWRPPAPRGFPNVEMVVQTPRRLVGKGKTYCSSWSKTPQNWRPLHQRRGQKACDEATLSRSAALGEGGHAPPWTGRKRQLARNSDAQQWGLDLNASRPRSYLLVGNTPCQGEGSARFHCTDLFEQVSANLTNPFLIAALESHPS